MALFTDGPVSNILDLTARDSQLLGVASTEGIDVTQKMQLAQDEIGLELITLLDRLSYVDQAFWLAPQPGLDNVVVTPAVKAWHTLRSLELVYADGYNSQLNDRYAGRRDQFHKLADWAYEKLIQIGVGICTLPVAQPAIPNLVTALPPAGGQPLADGTYYVTTAWINSRCEESAAAIPNAISTVGGSFGVDPGPVPKNATAWNVYVGTAPDTMSLQNGAPIVAGQTWLQPGLLAAGGRAPGTGQSPQLHQAGSADVAEGLMAATIGNLATSKVIQQITGPQGMNAGLAALVQPSDTPAGLLDASQVRSLNAAADLTDKSVVVQYPAVNVYCEKLSNKLTEKFRSFSGTAQMAIEVRHSQDRLDGLQDVLALYADAVTQTLATGRGSWGDGMFYGGAYEVAFGPVKKGGRNFIQVAKVTFEIGVSRS